METTRRTLLRNAGVAAAGSMMFQAAARAEQGSAGAPASAKTGSDWSTAG